MGVACYVHNKVCFLCSPASSPLASFFTYSAELKELYDARPQQFTHICLFFIYGYFFNSTEFFLVALIFV